MLPCSGQVQTIQQDVARVMRQNSLPWLQLALGRVLWRTFHPQRRSNMGNISHFLVTEIQTTPLGMNTKNLRNKNSSYFLHESEEKCASGGENYPHVYEYWKSVIIVRWSVWGPVNFVWCSLFIFLASTNLKQHINLRSNLRSASSGLLCVPASKTVFGSRSFAMSCPSAWNSLSSDIRSTDLSLLTFRNKLKTYLFSDSIWDINNYFVMFLQFVDCC